MSAGATFKKIDLHLHAPGKGQYFNLPDGLNEPKTPEERREFAHRYVIQAHEVAGLAMIAITNHNETSWINPIREAAKTLYGDELIVLPGLEIGVDGGLNSIHILAIFPEETPTEILERLLDDDLKLPKGQRFDANGHVMPSERGFSDALEYIVNGRNGIAIAAHVFSSEDSLLDSKSNKGQTRRKQYLCKVLTGLDLAGFSLDQLQEKQSEWGYYLVTNQHRDPSHRRERPIGLLNCSDARRLEEIGRHYSYLKCEQPSFEALRQGLLDPEARLRLQDDPPQEPLYSLERLQVTPTPTGFLRGLDLAFNPNLNCLIGGRGTGKSATVELIRYIWGLKPLKNDTQRFMDVFLPESGQATLDVRTPEAQYRLVKNGREKTELYRREKDGELSSVKDFTLANLHELIPLAVYGQKEILYTSQDVRSQLDLLDRLISQDIDVIKSELANLALQLRQNRESILNLTDQIEDANQKLSRRAIVEEKITAYTRSGLGEKVETKRLIDREEQAWELAAERLGNISELIDQLPYRLDFDLGFLDDKEISNLPDVDLLFELRGLLQESANSIRMSSEPLSRALKQSYLNLEKLKNQWDSRRDVFNIDYQKSLMQLPDLTPDQVLKLERERAQLDVIDRGLDQLIRQRKERITFRRNLLSRVESEASKLFTQRRNKALDLTRKIRRVAVVIEKSGDKEAASETLQNYLRGSRLYQTEYECMANAIKTRWLSFLALLEVADESLAADERVYSTYLPKTKDGKVISLAEFCGISEEKTRRLTERLGLAERLELDEIQIPDLVSIHIDISPPEPSDTNILDLDKHDDEKVDEKLERASKWPSLGQALGSGVSIGQGCTAILSIILLESNRPLLIDQPEDDLDNRFIYDGVVRLLRDMRGQRQIIMATHNPNIPVGGDAELIVALEAVSDEDPTRLQARIVASGFIDEPNTRDQVKLILEGGDAAFARRRRKYGF
ncbi:MAG: AAA family ATPase [Anaerolineales bacterium]|nr:AAA family ATPase [Anaerolineales bacterium]